MDSKFCTVSLLFCLHRLISSVKIPSTRSVCHHNNFTMEIVCQFTYPVVRRDESIIDDFHGTKVTDPYRWLENADSDETNQFIEAENEISRSFLENNDKWKKINNKLTAMWNYAKYSAPARYGKYYFSYQNSGLQNQE